MTVSNEDPSRHNGIVSTFDALQCQNKYQSLSVTLICSLIKRIVRVITYRLTFVIPLTMASNDSRTKPNVVKSKSTSSMKPPGLECVCVLLIITFLSVYMSPNWICNLRNTCGKKNKSRLISRDNRVSCNKSACSRKTQIVRFICAIRCAKRRTIFDFYII